MYFLHKIKIYSLQKNKRCNYTILVKQVITQFMILNINLQISITQILEREK